MRFLVHVHTRARTARVGGRRGDGDPPVLEVRVRASATGGRANDAVIAALAEAFDAPRDRVRIVRGRTSRTKLVEVDGDAAVLERLLTA